MGFHLCSIKYYSLKGQILGSHISHQNRNYILLKEKAIVSHLEFLYFIRLFIIPVK